MVKRIEINENEKSVTVRLRNVRLSFPSLFEPKAFSEGDKATYQATFLMDKEGDQMDNAELVKKGVKEMLRMNNKGASLPADRVCLKCGSTKSHLDGYDDTVFFTPSSNAKPVAVVDRDMTVLKETDGKPYAGCYVNATVRLWWQDNKWGRRVNAQVRAVQFFGDGDPFGQSGADVETEFEDCSGDSSANGGDEDWI